MLDKRVRCLSFVTAGNCPTKFGDRQRGQKREDLVKREWRASACMFVRVRVSAVVEVELRYGLVPTSNAAEIQIQIQIQNVLHVGAS